jgi:hypothetical protein
MSIVMDAKFGGGILTKMLQKCNVINLNNWVKLLSDHSVKKSMSATGQIKEARSEERLAALPHRFAVPARGPLETQLEALKEQLLKPALATVTDLALVKELKWAATEAAALAWYTGFPTLVLPALLEEKLLLASKRWERQQEIRALAA